MCVRAVCAVCVCVPKVMSVVQIMTMIIIISYTE